MRLGVPTLVNFDGLAALIESAERSSLRPSGYDLIFNGALPPETWPGWTIPGTARYTVLQNPGVAASWNTMLERSEPIIIANDDIVLGKRAFEEIARALETHPFVGSGWCLFGQTPECTNRVGFYDENFWPAYYEDSDYDVRLRRAGIEPFWDCSEPVEHAGCWTTFNKLGQPEWMQAAIEQNRLYFMRKWGGMPPTTPEERGKLFDGPFGGYPPEGWRLRSRTRQEKE